MNNEGKELAAKKKVSTIKCMLNKKPRQPICMTWKEDHIKELQENHNNQECEEERKSPEKDRGLVDIKEDWTPIKIWLQLFRKKVLETTCYNKELFLMDGHQQSKTMIEV
jgi:hypothetical protein